VFLKLYPHLLKVLKINPKQKACFWEQESPFLFARFQITQHQAKIKKNIPATNFWHVLAFPLSNIKQTKYLKYNKYQFLSCLD